MKYKIANVRKIHTILDKTLKIYFNIDLKVRNSLMKNFNKNIPVDPSIIHNELSKKLK